MVEQDRLPDMEIPDHPNPKFSSVHHFEPCAVCGSETSEAPTGFLHICRGGNTIRDVRHIDASGVCDDEAGCLKMNPVGSSCIRRFKEIRPYLQR